jgi:uncharacterized membrane protein
MDHAFIVKWLHVLSSTVLFGTGLGTAFFFWSAHQTSDPRTIAAVGRMVVRADWLFTATSGVIQPVTGAMLIHGFGYRWNEPWLLATYGLYVIAFACWLPVVWLQVRMRDLARAAAADGTPLPPQYHRAARLWFTLGWPAFVALAAVFYLMIVRPG